MYYIHVDFTDRYGYKYFREYTLSNWHSTKFDEAVDSWSMKEARSLAYSTRQKFSPTVRPNSP